MYPFEWVWIWSECSRVWSCASVCVCVWFLNWIWLNNEALLFGSFWLWSINFPFLFLPILGVYVLYEKKKIMYISMNTKRKIISNWGQSQQARNNWFKAFFINHQMLKCSNGVDCIRFHLRVRWRSLFFFFYFSCVCFRARIWYHQNDGILRICFPSDFFLFFALFIQNTGTVIRKKKIFSFIIPSCGLCRMLCILISFGFCGCFYESSALSLSSFTTSFVLWKTGFFGWIGFWLA